MSDDDGWAWANEELQIATNEKKRRSFDWLRLFYCNINYDALLGIGILLNHCFCSEDINLDTTIGSISCISCDRLA